MTLLSLVDGITILYEHSASAFSIEDAGNLFLWNTGAICQTMSSLRISHSEPWKVHRWRD